MPIFLVTQIGILWGSLTVAFWVLLAIALYRPEWLRDGVWALAVLAFGLGIILTGEADAKKEFYEATAQVVPVLFLALAVQIQAFRSDRPRHPEDLRPAAITALALVYAEVECLDVLATGDPRGGAFELVVGALAAAAVAIALPVILGGAPSREPSITDEPDSGLMSGVPT